MSLLGKQVWGHPIPAGICARAPQTQVCQYLRSQQLTGKLAGPSQRMFTSASSSNGVLGSEAEPSGNGSGGGGLAVAIRTDAGRIVDTSLQDEVQKSYLAYAMSVIVGRALPDVRDGLKPVHRRILYAMHDLGLSPSKPFRKSARVVGEVLGKYHPHGDTAVYDALVRLAQPFSMRLPLVNGHGNFGSQDDDPAAAMRYTECRLQEAASAALLADLEYDTVDFLDTFDGSQQEPTVLPARLPNLLINGSQGIAVGMATNIPPHNMGEVVAALEALIRDPNITTAQLMDHIPGPDFPTGGEILAANDLGLAYESGRGPITVRGRTYIEGDEEVEGEAPEVTEGKKAPKRKAKKAAATKPSIVITELPYQTNKAKLVIHIASLVDDGTLQGVADVRDESDRDGMRVVVEVKRGFSPEVVVNSLYQHTQLQKRFSCNMVALDGSTPRTLGLKDFLSLFLDFRCEVITRRANFELSKAEKRAHIVGGLITAQGSLDQVVKIIRAARDGPEATEKLQAELGLTDAQSEAVLSMALRRLTSMEAGKLQQEAAELQERVDRLQALLGSPDAIRETVGREAREIADKHGNPRRTAVRRDVDGVLQTEDIIPNKQSLIVYSSKGYIKRMTPDLFSIQGRGGKGMRGTRLRDNDSVEEVQQVWDHQSILFFTSDGKVYSVKAHQIPEASKAAAGSNVSQLLKIGKEQKVAAMLPVHSFTGTDFVLMLTRQGLLKRCRLSAFAKIQSAGKTAISLAEGNELVWVRMCKETDDMLIATAQGMVTRYPVNLFREYQSTGGGMGIKSIKLAKGDQVTGMAIIQEQWAVPTSSEEDEEEEDGSESEGEESSSVSSEGDEAAAGPSVLFVTDKGLGKKVPTTAFRPYLNRGARGVRGIRLTEGDQLAICKLVHGESDVLLSSNAGNLIRQSLSEVKTQGRATRGTILMRPKNETDKITSATLLGAAEDSSI